MGKNDRKTDAKKRSQGWTIRRKNIKNEWHNVRMENCSLEKKRKNTWKEEIANGLSCTKYIVVEILALFNIRYR